MRPIISRCAIFLTISTVPSIQSVPALAQNRQAPPPVIKVQTSLVVIPTVVTDKFGKPITDLTQQDFTVKEDGKPQTIAVFERVSPAASSTANLALPPGVYSNRAKREHPTELTIIVVDGISTGMLEKLEARREILEFIARNVRTDHPVALFLMQETGVKVLHDFTTEPAVLTAALRNVIGGRTAQGAIQADRQTIESNSSPVMTGLQDTYARMIATETDTIQSAFQGFTGLQRRVTLMNTLDSFYLIAQAFAGVPGRKSLLWITNGSSLQIGDTQAAAQMTSQLGPNTQNGPHYGPGMNSYNPSSGPSAPMESRGGTLANPNLGPELQPAFDRVWHALNSSDIAVYPLDISDLADPAFSDPGRRLRGALDRPYATTFRMEEMAAQTGGTPCLRNSELDDCFKHANADSQTYYLLAYYPDPNKTKKDWRKLDVVVAGRDLKVRARNGYFPSGNAKPDEEKQVAADLVNALRSPVEYTTLPLDVKVQVLAVSGLNDKKRVSFALFVPPSAKFVNDGQMNLEFVAVATLADGRTAGEFSRRAAGPLQADEVATYTQRGVMMPGTFDLPAGEYRLKFVARDNQGGRVGSVTVPITVSLGKP